MAYDERLESRIREVMEHDGTEYVCKHMFGGVAFMVGGRMTVGIVKDDLMVKVGPDGHDAAMRERHVRPMDFTGKPMRGIVYVDAAGVTTSTALSKWVRAAVAHAASLPARPPKASKTKKAVTKKAAKTATKKTAKATTKKTAKATTKKAATKKTAKAATKKAG